MVDKIVIFGGSGFLGKRLIELIKEDYEIIVASRNAEQSPQLQDGKVKIVQFSYDVNSFVNIIEGSDIIVNFSGASIADRRWTYEYKKIMYDSRVKTTALISEAISKCVNKPHTFVSTSATGIYGNRGDELLYEDSLTGNDYLANLCKEWENEALKSGIRTVCIRVGVVLDKNEGGFKKMVQPFRFFVGGALGNGRQYLPWIHINDIVNIYKEAITNASLNGIVNGTAPYPVTSNVFSKAVGKILNRPGIFKVPKIVLKIVVGEFAEFLTGSQRAIPKKLLEAGFSFEYKEIEETLKNLIRKSY
jgi:uncharacterized protein (TIGR01777 family)